MNTRHEITLPIPVDHVGIVGYNLELMIESFRRLGFFVREATELDSGVTKERKVQKNTHIVFPVGYLELIQSTGDDHLSPYIEKGEGLHIVALHSSDIHYSHQAVEKLKPALPSNASREAKHGKKTGEAKFSWFGFEKDSFPEGLICITKHETPELIFQESLPYQPNGVTGICEIFVYVNDLNEGVERYKDLLQIHGTKKMPNTSCMKITLLDKQGIKDRYPKLKVPLDHNCILGASFTVRSLDQVTGILDYSKVQYEEQDGEVWVYPGYTHGAFLSFVTKS